MEKNKTIVLQLIFLSVAFISFELAIYLLIPSWITILLMLGVNSICFAAVIEVVDIKRKAHRAP